MRSLIIWLALMIIASSCMDSDSAEQVPEQTVSFTGKANKGPFLTGSEVTIVELDRHLRPTGKTFFTEILDNDGSYSVDGIKLKSDYIEVRVEGFFYDEVMRTTPESELSISSLVKIGNGPVSHVNILTHLERKRVVNLMDNGASFESAKAQAYSEMMEVFGFTTQVAHSSEQMELLTENDASSILFAASCIIAATVPWKYADDFALWNSFLVQFANDFGDDGKIDNQQILKRLYGGAYYVKNNIERIKLGIVDKFKDQFFDYEIPEFEIYIDQALAASPFTGTFEDMINRIFPKHAGGAINILRLENKETIHPDSTYVIHISPQPSAIPYQISLTLLTNEGQGKAHFPSEGWSQIYETEMNREIFHVITDESTTAIHYGVTFSGKGSFDYSINGDLHFVPIDEWGDARWQEN